MSHDQTIKKQEEMGKSYDAKILSWTTRKKKRILSWEQEVESRELSKKLLSEVIEKQSDKTAWKIKRKNKQNRTKQKHNKPNSN